MADSIRSLSPSVAQLVGGLPTTSTHRSISRRVSDQLSEDINTWFWLATLAPVDSTVQAAGFIAVELQSMAQNTLRVRTCNANAAVAADAAAFVVLTGHSSSRAREVELNTARLVATNLATA